MVELIAKSPFDEAGLNLKINRAAGIILYKRDTEWIKDSMWHSVYDVINRLGPVHGINVLTDLNTIAIKQGDLSFGVIRKTIVKYISDNNIQLPKE